MGNIQLFVLIMAIPSVCMHQIDTYNCNCNKNEYFYEDCGHIIGTSTINNGEVAYPGQFPWQVLVGVEDFNTGKSEICGGSLITHQHILTAAHCVFGKTEDQISVLVGHIDWKKAQDTGSEDFFYIVDIEVYPSFIDKDAWRSEPDVGILTLEHSVSFSTRDLQNQIRFWDPSIKL